MTGRFDARAHWNALTPEQQREFGEMALLMLVSGLVAGEETLVERRWEHAHNEAGRRIDDVLPDPDDFAEGPDLAAVGIRACRGCGCTDDSACEEGCEWVEEDLCSACVAQADAAE